MAKHLFGFWLLFGLAVFAACGGPLAPVDATRPQAPAVAPQVLVVTLSGKLGTLELARCTRALREAATHGVRFVVFRLQDAGSQGEDLDDVQSLLDRVQASAIETVALVQGRTTQGAAQLAVCTDRLYFLGNGVLGEITKHEGELDELLAADPDSAMAQRFDGMREALRGRLERRKQKLRPEAEKLVLAMADPRTQLFEATVREGGFERTRLLDTNELTALQGSGATVIAPEKMTRPAEVRAQGAEQYGLSNGTLQSVEQLAEVLTVDRDAMAELVVDWAEHMVGWLELLQPFLLVAGFVLILFEVKTPGVGLPGLLGTAFLALAMFYSYLVGLAEVTEILVFFLGLAAIAVEIFLLPGTVVFGAVGFLCLVLALVLSQQSFVMPQNAIEEDILLHNLTNVTLLFVMVLVLGFATWRILPKVPWFNRVFLPPPQPQPAAGGHSGLGMPNERLTALVGRTGKAATVLRPTGTMEVDGEPYDVVTEGEFVEPGTPLRVLYVQGNRVVVAAEAAGRAGERGSVGVVVLLVIVGLVLIVAEVFFVSFGVIALLAGAALFGAVFVAFQESTSFGVTMVAVEAVAAPLVLAMAFKLLPRTPFGRQLILAGPATPGSAGAADPGLQALLHKTGVTLSALRPAGFARIDGKKVDVVTRGEMVPADAEIVVVEVTGNRVVVAHR
ncbi:MAG: hypothetical protein JNM25_19975 [Planctomycetes bacterium]|nr:hypothetical protein [Planctomycetota bacterium]